MSVFGFKDVLYRIEYNGRVKNAVIEDVSPQEYLMKFDDGSEGWHSKELIDSRWLRSEAATMEVLPAEENAVSPNVYKFPNAEVRDISAHLTSFGGQAVQYVAHATRLDGLVKGKPEQDIEKAIQVLQWELERLQAAS